MDAITKVIQQRLNMTLDQFCSKHLNCERQAFSVRLRKGKLYPNEYLYISLITGTPVKELFGKSFEDTFIYRGDPDVSDRLRQVIATVNDPEKLTNLLSAEITIPVSGEYNIPPSPEYSDPLHKEEILPEPKPTAKAPVPEEPEPVFKFEDTFV